MGAAWILACTGPNPNLDAGADESSEGTDTGDETDTGTETDTGETDTGGATCEDQKHNGNETDQDCGGDCPQKCDDGQMCAGADDCQSGVCGEDDRCAEPTCDDEVQNGDELMVDCGGACEVCVLEGPDTDWADPKNGIDRFPSVDMLADGSFAIAWQADGDIRLRWFGAEGQNPSAGAEAHPPTGNVDEQPPEIAVEDGDPRIAAITWAEAAGADKARFSIFDDDLAAVVTSILVNEDLQLSINAVDNDLRDGTLYTVYGATPPSEVYFRRFDAATGNASDVSDIEIIDETDNGESSPRIAVASSGDALAVWLHSGNGDFDAVGRVRTAGGSWTPGDFFQVHVPNTSPQVRPDVAALDDDRFVVVWDGDTDHDDQGVAARIIDTDGTPVGTDIPVNETTDGSQDSARVAGLEGGGFAVAWRDAASETVTLRRFDANGEPIRGEESPWGQTTNLDQSSPAIASAGSSIVVVWSDGLDLVGVVLGH